ncbi:MAG TPA: hypothetical protein VK585_15390 [Jiangellaceae bacterium]|nr:hypothetical protein [Jiangellaceae bacterium]
MVRPGEEDILQLIASGEVEQVQPDRDLADLLMDDAQRHLLSAEQLADDDPAGAFQMAYDASRKACSALLAVQGLRATSRGGHIAVRDVARAQFGPERRGQVLREFDSIRRRRKDAEYPQDSGDAIDADEVRKVLPKAQAIVDYAVALLPHIKPW